MGILPRACAVPRDALMQRHLDAGHYADCFEVMHPGVATLEQFVTAFYSTWLFRGERVVLSAMQRRWIRDGDVAALAAGADHFAIWRVTGRAPGQILLEEDRLRTASWLAAAPKEGGVTRLVFGSVVKGQRGAVAGAVLPAHRVYARALLRLAEWRLRRG